MLDCSLQLDTPLMLAANNGYLNVVRYLVEHTEAGEVFDDRAEAEKKRAEEEAAAAAEEEEDDEEDEKEEDEDEEDEEEDEEEAQQRRDEARAKRKQARADARKHEQQLLLQQQQSQPKFVLGLEQKVGSCCCYCCRYCRHALAASPSPRVQPCRGHSTGARHCSPPNPTRPHQLPLVFALSVAWKL